MSVGLHGKLTAANKVTICRILGLPPFVLLLMYYNDSLKAGDPDSIFRYMALGLFVLIAATDALDGYLARSRNEITWLGRVLDPIADKALLISALVFLTRPSIPELQPQFPMEFTFLVISRDVILVLGALGIDYFTGSLEVRPHWTGKTATALLMICIVWVLLRAPLLPFYILVSITALLAIISGIIYIIAGIRQVEQKGAHERD